MGFTADFVIIGHRGAAGLAPENTIAGFTLADRLGVDAIEFDIQLVDGHLAVFHDDSLERTTNGEGKLKDISWAELRRLDAGEGQCVPELAEVSNCLRDSTGINIELKGPGTGGPCAEHLRSNSLRQEVIVSSFEVRELRALQSGLGKRLDSVRLGLLTREARMNALQEAAALKAWSIHLHESIATRSYVKQVLASGFQVFVYTVNNFTRMAELRDLGVKGIFTDYPNRMRLD